MSYAGAALAAQIGNIVRANTDIPVVAYLLGAAEVTHYAVACKISAYISQFAHAGLDLLVPVFSWQNAKAAQLELRATYLLASKVAASCGLFLGSAALALAKPFITVWMGSAYLDAYLPLLWLVMTVIISITQIPTANLLFGIARHRRYAELSWSEGALFVVLAIALGRRFGLAGVAAVRCCLAFPVQMVLQPVYACSVSGIPARQFFGAVGRASICGGLAVALAIVWSSERPLGRAYDIAFAVVYSGLAMAQWFVAFGLSERRRIERAIRRLPAP